MHQMYLMHIKNNLICGRQLADRVIDASKRLPNFNMPRTAEHKTIRQMKDSKRFS